MELVLEKHRVYATTMMAVIVLFLMQSAVLAQKRPVLFELETMTGETYRLADELGEKVIILNFWATWCRPCLREMPHVNNLYEKYKDQNLQVLAISIDTAASLSRIRPTINRHRFTFPVLLDTDNNVIRNYSPNRNVPYMVIIGADGTIVREFSGYRPGDEQLVERIVQQEIEKLKSKDSETAEPLNDDKKEAEEIPESDPGDINNENHD